MINSSFLFINITENVNTALKVDKNLFTVKTEDGYKKTSIRDEPTIIQSQM